MNFGNIQVDTGVRTAATVCIVLAFIASLIVMVFDFINHGSNFQLPTIVNTILTSVLTFAVASLSSHQGAQIQQNGASTGANTVASTTLAAADALEKVAIVTNGNTTQQQKVTQENTVATQENTDAMKHPTQ